MTLTNDHWANLGKDNYTLTQIIVESISKNATLYWLKLLLSQSVMTQLNTDSNKWLLSQSVKTLYIDSNKWYLSDNYTNSMIVEPVSQDTTVHWLKQMIIEPNLIKTRQLWTVSNIWSLSQSAKTQLYTDKFIVESISEMAAERNNFTLWILHAWITSPICG